MQRKHLKDYFIPHKGNGYAPNSLQKAAVGGMLTMVLLSFAVANIHALLWISSDWLVSTILPAVIVDLTNEEREDEALGTLRRSAVLDAAAKLKAEHMAEGEYFAHYSPDGRSPWYWFDEVGYDYLNAGENLAVRFTDSDEVVEAWMESPGHRANIMNGAYTEIGVGTAEGMYKGSPTVFVVQLFGTPAAPRVLGAGDQIEGGLATDTAQPDDTTIEVVTFQDVAGASTTPQTQEEVAPAHIETVGVFYSDKNSEETADIESAREGSRIESEPAPVIVETEEAPATPPPTQITYAGVSTLFSDLATTSRPGVVAMTDVGTSAGNTIQEPVSLAARSATQPHTWLQIVYLLMALFIAICLTLSIVIEWRKQHPIQITYGVGLLGIMAILFFIHTAVTAGVTII